MKRIKILLNGGEYVNITADRMELRENAIMAWNGTELVAYVDISAVICANMIESIRSDKP